MSCITNVSSPDRMKHLDGNALCSISNSVLSFTGQLLRASRRGKRKLIIVSCKSLTNAMEIGKYVTDLQILL